MEKKEKQHEIGIQRVKNLYCQEYLVHGVKPKSLFWPKGRQKVRFREHLELIENKKLFNKKLTLIDYGCGFSDLYEYMTLKNLRNIDYVGIDIVEEFLSVSKSRYPQCKFFTRDEFLRDESVVADILIASGTFNIRYESTYQKNYDFFLDELKTLASRIQTCLSVDFMTDEVDYMQLDSFHLNPKNLRRDIKKTISAEKVEIYKSEIPFEYRVQIWK